MSGQVKKNTLNNDKLQITGVTEITKITDDEKNTLNNDKLQITEITEITDKSSQSFKSSESSVTHTPIREVFLQTLEIQERILYHLLQAKEGLTDKELTEIAKTPNAKQYRYKLANNEPPRVERAGEKEGLARWKVTATEKNVLEFKYQEWEEQQRIAEQRAQERANRTTDLTGQIQRFKEFLEENYLQELLEAARKEQNFLNINFATLAKYDFVIANILLEKQRKHP